MSRKKTLKKKFNIQNKKFGNLIVISKVKGYKHLSAKDGYTHTAMKWKCICICGNSRIVMGSHLRNGRITACYKCSYSNRKRRNTSRNIWQRMFDQRIVNRCKFNGRKNRKTTKILTYSITIDEFKVVVSKDCVYCGAPPLYITNFRNSHVSDGSTHGIYVNGIDRIDSNKGYDVNNCVACCRQCNIMKMDLSLEEFKQRVTKIYNFWAK